MHEVIMPKLGLTMETGTIEKWHKKEGDKVEVGDVLFEVMTDKVSLEVEAYDSGYLKKILRAAGEEVPVTEVVAYIGEADEKIPVVSKVKPDAGTATSAGVKKPDPSVAGTGIIETTSIDESSINESRINISPLARNIAEGKNIDISKIAGTGPGGRIVKEDVLAFIEAQKAKTKPTSAPAAGAPSTGGEIKIKSLTPLKGIRKIIAERLTYSSQNIPHIMLTVVPDVGQLVALSERLKDKGNTMYQVKVTITDFITKLCATVLEEQPNINSSFQNSNHVIYEDINIGIAVSIDEGLIVPTIYNTNKLNIFEIAKKRTELVEKAKANKLTLDEISNGTFTISNLGMFGIRTFTSIINPPQGAILSVGEIYTAPAFIDGKIEAGSFMEISIAVDHRIIDGAVAARFLQRFVELIENPGLLAI